MKTFQMVFTFILAFTIFLTNQSFAEPTPGDDAPAPLMEVVYNGVEGDYLLFTVKATVGAKAFFVIKNETGDDLYREVCYEGNNVRKIRIQKSDIRSVQFQLTQKKKQCSRIFKISTQYEETINVSESAR